ncbi:hypothetical protein ACFYYI_17995 [Streptomyces sp. NPDC002387]|uniref:hypothetical protein n=1 Tax=Streptomyces sp. NPDC002387 TaxID=3364643 RepID=UPI0036892E3D
MSDAFTVLWTHDTCRALRKAGREGERPPVAYSGIHSSLPAWSGARAEDEVYALHVNRCVVYVVTRMRVIDMGQRDCCRTPGHGAWSMLGASGCGAKAVHVDATPVRFDIPIPGELLANLTWRNRRGQTRGLKHVVDGRLERSASLQGFYRLTPDSATALAEVVSPSIRSSE